MKICNATGKCKHKRELDANEAGFPECAYTDFCDFQLPRDSRGQCKCKDVFKGDVYKIVEDCPVHGWKR